MLDLNPILPLPMLVMLWGVAATVALVWSATLLPNESRSTRWLLLGLRTAVFVLVLAVAARPDWESIEEIVEKSRLYVLRDASDSMEMRDMPNQQNRIEAIDSALRQNAAAMQQLADSFDMESLEFARSLPAQTERTDGTALGDAILHISDQALGARVSGIIVLSDGVNNTGANLRDAAMKLQSRGVPVHAVIVGRAEFGHGQVDALLLDIDSPAAIDKGRSMQVTLEGVWRGLDGRESRIDCLIDGQVVATETVTPSGNDNQFRHQINVPIEQDAGFHKLTVALQVHDGEVSPQNNQLSAWFKVKEDGIQVLLLDTALRPEFKFLRRFLETREGITVTAKSPFWLRTAEGKAFLAQLDVPGYDVFLLGDLQRDTLGEPTWLALHNVIRNRGAGLLVIGGPHTMVPGPWAGNSIEPALPMEMKSGKPKVESFTMSVPPDATGHFLARPFAVTDNTSPIAGIAMLGLRNPSVEAKAATEVILADDAGQPVLGVGGYYRGRCGMLLSDCLWNWVIESPETRALYDQFWTRMIYWLASREDGLNANLSIMLGKNRFAVGSNIPVTGDLLDAENLPVIDANVTLKLSDLNSDASEDALMFFESGRYGTVLRPTKPGHYSLRAETELNGETLLSNELRVTVFAPRIEERTASADAAAMADLAGRTGGESMPLAELPGLLKRLPAQAKTVRLRKTTRSEPLWDNAWVLLAALALLSVEWIVRRKSGLP
jgi:uncharacterized membrane protein